MKVVILAAGRSNRLKPLKDKNFIYFLGKPLIVHQLERLGAAGFKDFIIVGGEHNLKKLKEVTEDLPYKIGFAEQENLDEGMAGAVKSVEDIVSDDPFLVVSGNDIVESTAFEQIKAAHRLAEHGLLLAKEVESYFPGGYLKVDSDFVCKDIIEKPGPGNEPSNLVNIVVHYFGHSSNLFKALHAVESPTDDVYEVAIEKMIKDGLKIRAIPYEGFWQSVKFPWHVLDLMEHFLAQRSEDEVTDPESEDVDVAESAIIKGGVYMEKGVKVMDNAVIIGPTYIGENTVIATNSLVRNSHIGSNCVIGFGTEVVRSYLGNNVWCHSNYIGDSVIGNNCSFGAGTVTGNLRLDEGNVCALIKDEKTDSGRNKFGIVMGDNVRCGINISFMPGIKIGNDSMVGAGIILGEDVDDGKFVCGKTDLIVKDNKAQLDSSKREEMQQKINQS